MYLRLISPCLSFGIIKCLISTQSNGSSTYPGVLVNLPRRYVGQVDARGRVSHNV